ncbi:unnamed protein product [Sphenostylis stenocarpa]|uniref:Uncharacterized protein n=1 Tax=Sphenostylis stenocarpa TaxID=92480 RepID=A0AA86RR45_9FABA|nr:unnamed protein product [Sphenostylis stenocarpa]
MARAGNYLFREKNIDIKISGLTAKNRIRNCQTDVGMKSTELAQMQAINNLHKKKHNPIKFEKTLNFPSEYILTKSIGVID